MAWCRSIVVRALDRRLGSRVRSPSVPLSGNNLAQVVRTHIRKECHLLYLVAGNTVRSYIMAREFP